MAIVRTKPFLIAASLKKRKQILETMQFLNCSQIEEIESKKKEDVSEIIKTISDMETKAEKAISIISKYVFSKNSMKTIKKVKEIEILKTTIKEQEKNNDIIKIVLDCKKKIMELEKEIEKINIKNSFLKNYVNLDVPIKNLKTKNITLLFGEINSNYEKTYNEKFLKIKDIAYSEQIFRINQNSAIYIIYLNKFEEKVRKFLNEIDFVLTTTQFEKPPKEEILANNKKIKEMQRKIINLENEIKNNSENLESLKIFVDWLKLRREKYETIKKLIITKNVFLLKGYVNAKYLKKLEEIIVKEYDSHIEVFEKEQESSPVFFSNNFFVTPVENVTKTYSMPSKNDIDPNPVMAFFYYMFFGMMFSDAGYGIILSFACLLMLCFKKINKEKKESLKMFLFCGISTTFWGFMYGSFFGDVIFTFSNMFLNKNLNLAPIWINTTQDPLTLLIFSISIGILQILIGIILKFYIHLKEKNLKEAFFCTFNWIVTLLGIELLTSNFMLKSDVLAMTGKLLVLFGLVLTLIFSGYKNKGIMKIVGGIINIYGITSYISDILSYSRLMALGIATGVIANVVNILASMAGKDLFGKLIFILVFIVGHLLNFSINILGAYVHTNRLQYVEFFSKFYTGGGRLFKPFGIHTKYFEFFKK